MRRCISVLTSAARPVVPGWVAGVSVAHVQRVHGVVQHYAWGDPVFIPSLLGVEPDGEPWAELWLGTHPSGPATLDDGRPLERPHRRAPVPAEGPRRRRAALTPGSIPTPNRPVTDSSAGSIPTRTPSRNCCAHSPSSTRCAASARRRHAGTPRRARARRARRSCLADVLASDGPRGVADGALHRHDRRRNPIVDACATSDRAEAAWVGRLAERYPGDPSVVATLLLNLVHLSPGEALRLGPGNLHAYLHGAAIELMGPSDNVVRAGLTRKPVDVDELLRIVDTTPLAEPVIGRRRTATGSTTTCNWCGSKPATSTAPSATRSRSTSAARRGTSPPATSAS